MPDDSVPWEDELEYLYSNQRRLEFLLATLAVALGLKILADKVMWKRWAIDVTSSIISGLSQDEKEPMSSSPTTEQ